MLESGHDQTRTLERRMLRPEELDHELIWLLTSLGMALVGAAWLHFGLPHPHCHFKAATGFPCPTCGTTRATIALLRGDMWTAIQMNPLYVAFAGFVAGYDVYAATVIIGRLPRIRIVAGSHVRVFRWVTIAVILINWAWLVYRGV